MDGFRRIRPERSRPKGTYRGRGLWRVVEGSNKTVSDHKRDNTLTRNLGTHDGAGIVAERDLQLPPRD